MKTKIFFLLFFSSFCLTSAQAQWKMVYDGDKGWPRLFTDGNNLIMFNNESGVAISKDSGFSWKQVDTSFVMKYAGGIIRKNNKLLSPTWYGIYQSLDSGYTWNFLSSWPTWGSNWGGLWMSGNNILSRSQYDRVIISKDDGFSWDSSNTGILPTRISPMNVRSFWGFANHGNNILAFQEDKVYISYNNGETWKFKRDNLPFFTYRHYTIGDNIFACGTDLYISKDSGNTWEMVFSAKSKLNGVGNLVGDGKIIAAFVQNEGIIISKDNGIHWQYMNNGLPTLEVGVLVVKFGYLYTGTATGKIYRRPLNDFEGPEELVGINDQDRHHLNSKVFPNPIQNSTTIEFGKNLRNGELRIFNISGQEVQTIQNINSGEVNLQRKSLPAGIYFYEILESNIKVGFGKLIFE